MLRCEYKDPNSPAPHINCCDSFGSDPEDFQASCVNRLGGQVHKDGQCEAFNLPWMPQGSPGRWRGSCALVPTDPQAMLPGVMDDPSSKEGQKIYNAPDVLRIEHNGKAVHADHLPKAIPTTSGEQHPAHRTHPNLDGKVQVVREHL